MEVRIENKGTFNADNQYGPSPFKTKVSSFGMLLIFFEW